VDDDRESDGGRHHGGKDAEPEHVGFADGRAGPWTCVIESFNDDAALRIEPGIRGTVGLGLIIPPPVVGICNLRGRGTFVVSIHHARVAEGDHAQGEQHEDDGAGPDDDESDVLIVRLGLECPVRDADDQRERDEQVHPPVRAQHAEQSGAFLAHRGDLAGLRIGGDMIVRLLTTRADDQISNPAGTAAEVGREADRGFPGVGKLSLHLSCASAAQFGQRYAVVRPTHADETHREGTFLPMLFFQGFSSLLFCLVVGIPFTDTSGTVAATVAAAISIGIAVAIAISVAIVVAKLARKTDPAVLQAKRPCV